MKGKSGVSPSIVTALPKGGASVKSIDDAFETNLNSGAITYRVPIDIPTGRVEGELDLAFVYDSLAHGNSQFGMGWSIPILSVRRRTDHGVPTYTTADTFILSTGERLVSIGGKAFRTQVEQQFRKIILDNYRWLIIETDGTRITLGGTPSSRLSNPEDATQIFEWFISEIIDTNGNVVKFEYMKDDRWKRFPEDQYGNQIYLREIRYTNVANGRFDNVVQLVYDFSLCDQRRPDAWTSYITGFPVQTHWRCRKIVSFTTDLENTQARTVDLTSGQIPGIADPDIYVKHGLLITPSERGALRYEQHSFFRRGITVTDFQPLSIDLPIALNKVKLNMFFGEPGPYKFKTEDVNGNITSTQVQVASVGSQTITLVDTCTICRRIIIEGGGREWLLKKIGFGAFNPRPVVYSCYDLDYYQTLTEVGIVHPSAVSPTSSLLKSISRVGYDDQLAEDKLPMITFSYTRLDVSQLWPRPLEGCPNESLRDENTTLIPFLGNGRVDILKTDGVHRCYVNCGQIGREINFAGKDLVDSPSITLSDFETMLRDVNGRGSVDLSTTTFFYNNPATSPTPVDPNVLKWGDFEDFDRANPHPYLAPSEMLITRSIDLNGDGNVDLLKTGYDFQSWQNNGDGSWTGAEVTPRQHSFGSRNWPDVSFDDESIFIADMNGDGLDEIVRISSRKVEYWSQIYGRWQFKTTMLNSPRIAGFNPRRVLISDITNDGFADLIYIHSNYASVYLNCGGNRYSAELKIDYSDIGISRNVRIPSDSDSLEVVDLVGDGIKGILWSFERVNAESNYYYMPLSSAMKPNLLSAIDNGLGGRIEIDYSTSTLEASVAELQGNPWKHHIPLPVVVAKRIRKIDLISNSQEKTELIYRNGFYDRGERRFQGFGEVTEIMPGCATANGVRIVHRFANRDVQRLTGADLARARTLSGREMRSTHYDLQSGALLRDVHYGWDAAVVHDWIQEASGDYVPGNPLNSGDPENQIYFVTPSFELTALHEGTQNPRYSLTTRRYGSQTSPNVPNEFGNLLEEIFYGEVTTQGITPLILTLEIDGVSVGFRNMVTPEQKLTRFRYAINRDRHILRKPCAIETWAGTSFERLVDETRNYYDGGANRDDYLPIGEIEQGNLQRRERLVIHEQDVHTLFGGALLLRIGIDENSGPGYFLRSMSADGRAALFAVEERNVFLRGLAGIDFGVRLEVYDARCNATKITYDCHHWLVRGVENAKGHKTIVQRLHYRSGYPEEVKDPNRTVSRNVYDAFQRVVEHYPDVTAGNEPSELYVYADDVRRAGTNLLFPVCVERRQLIDRTEPQLRYVRTLMYHDGFGKLIQQRRSDVSGQFVVVSKRYNCHQLVDTETLPYLESGASYVAPVFPVLSSKKYKYDAVGRALTTELPAGSLERTVYLPWKIERHDGEDNEPTSPNFGTPTILTYNVNRKLIGVEDIIRFDPNGELKTIRTTLINDVFGFLTKRTDPDQIETEIRYSPRGEKLYQKHPDAGEQWTFYDAAGNIIYQRDARGNVIWLRYDELNRIVAEISVDDPAGQSDIDYSYDDAAANAVGRIHAVDDGAGKLKDTFLYDSLGNMSKRTRDHDGNQLTFEMEYNDLGLIRLKRYPNGDAMEQSYGVDGRLQKTTHQISSLNIGKDTFNKIEYHPNGEVNRIEYFGGNVIMTRSYDPSTHRLRAIETCSRGGAILQKHRFTLFDKVGNILEVRDETDPVSVATYRYTYDSLYRLRQAQYNNPGAAGYNFFYSYHNNGRFRMNEEFVAGQEIFYSSSSQPNAARGTTAQPHLFDYDTAGNMIKNRSLSSLKWNVRNQLIEVAGTSGDVLERYFYAYDGPRISKQEIQPNGAASGTVIYFDADYHQRPEGSIVRVMLGDISLGEFDPGGAGQVFLLNHLMSVIGIIDEVGMIDVQSVEVFTPFGQSHVVPASGKESRFSGKEHDGSALYYFGERYYDPNLGTWTSVDTKGQFHSPYSYTDGNPVNLVDLEGEDAVAIVFPDYKISAFGTKWSNLGHAGVLLIDNKTGLTKYYEYGRYDAAAKGIIRKKAIPNVKIKNGRPTKESLERVLEVVSKKAGHSGRVEGVYVPNDKFDQMHQYAKSRMAQNTEPNRKPYSTWSNNCGTFMVKTIEAGDVETPVIVDPRPNSIINELRDDYKKLDYSKKEGLKVGNNE